MHRSVHHVREGLAHFVWDNAIEPALEVDAGAVVELEVRDASGGQLDRDSTTADVAALDFARVNPVTGPVFVRGARPGDVLAVEILELRPRDWGWTAIIPGFGLLADEFPDPWLRISAVDAQARPRRASRDGVTLPYEPFPGTIGVAPAEPGRALDRAAVALGRQPRHQAPARRHDAATCPVGVEGALFSVGDTHAAMGDGEVCGTAVEAPMDITVRLERAPRRRASSAPQYHVPRRRAARAPRPAATTSAPGVGPRPDGGDPRRDARARSTHIVERHGREPRGGLRARLGRLPTCASTRWSTCPTGWSAASCPRPSSTRQGDDRWKRRATPRSAAACGASCASGRRSRCRSRSWRRPRRWRSTARCPRSSIGRAVPLAFIFATVGVLFVSYAFIRLSGYFSHAGSVYAFPGVTLGPRAGFFAGWALLGTYLAFTAASTAEAGCSAWPSSRARGSGTAPSGWSSRSSPAR